MSTSGLLDPNPNAGRRGRPRKQSPVEAPGLYPVGRAVPIPEACKVLPKKPPAKKPAGLQLDGPVTLEFGPFLTFRVPATYVEYDGQSLEER
jgi:hypothetical protein